MLTALVQYGNDASLNYQFSAAAILVVVPPGKKRLIAPIRPVEATIFDASQMPSPNPTSTTLDTPVEPTVGASDPLSAQSSSAGTVSRQLTRMSATPSSDSDMLGSNWSEDTDRATIKQGTNGWRMASKLRTRSSQIMNRLNLAEDVLSFTPYCVRSHALDFGRKALSRGLIKGAIIGPIKMAT